MRILRKQSSHSLKYFFLLSFFLLLLAVCAPAGSPALLSAHAAAAESEAQTIPFTDGSGRYLQLSNGRWKLRQADGSWLTGLQYIQIRKTGALQSGFYMFDEKGRLIQKQAVYHFPKQTVNGVRFKGYYLSNTSGRFALKNKNLKYLDLKCEGKDFQGYYFVQPYGKLSSDVHVHYLSGVRIGRTSLEKGYYYFDKTGRLITEQKFHAVKEKVNDRKFNGVYYFGGANGKLYEKRGELTVGGKRYYLYSTGKRYQDHWADGCYFQSDGTLAVSKQVPDGSYVDCDGHKCAKEEMALSPLKKKLAGMVGGYAGSWSVYVKNLETDDILLINDRSMYPASTIKAFVMASVYNEIANRRMTESGTVQSLLRSMITISDNESFNELVRMHSASRSFTAGAAVVNRYLKENGYTATGCHSTLHPSASASISDGGRNTSSAKDCGILLEHIYRGTCVSETYSRKMLNLLLGQQRRWKIPAGIPSGVRVANKTGETDSVQHDIAIVFGPKTDYVICVFSTGGGIYGIQRVSREVYQYLN